jgi:hypothetical protein
MWAGVLLYGLPGPACVSIIMPLYMHMSTMFWVPPGVCDGCVTGMAVFLGLVQAPWNAPFCAAERSKALAPVVGVVPSLGARTPLPVCVWLSGVVLWCGRECCWHARCSSKLPQGCLDSSCRRRVMLSCTGREGGCWPPDVMGVFHFDGGGWCLPLAFWVFYAPAAAGCGEGWC